MEKARELLVHIGFSNRVFDYNIYENTKSTGLFKRISNNIERKKQLNSKVHINKSIDNDDMVDYLLLLQYNNMTENNDNLYKEGVYFSGYKTFCEAKNEMANDLWKEYYIAATMRQLQLILNQPYININTNKVFRLYETFNMEKSTKKGLHFDVTTKDVPIGTIHDCLKNNETCARLSLSLTDYSYEDVHSINALAQSIKKISQQEVADMLELVNSGYVKNKIKYYKNNRHKFTRAYQ